MKLKTLLMSSVALLALASCNNDDQTGGPEPKTGEESVVTLTIYDATTRTRAAGTDTDAPTTAESTIDESAGIKVVVFDEDESLAYPLASDPLTLSLTETAPGSGIYTTGEFTVNAGEKYFYTFANDAANKITKPSPTMTRSQFIARTTEATLTAVDVLNLTDPNFLMGTLWSEKKTAAAGGEPGSPVVVPLTIGRLASKVTLSKVDQGTSTMTGTFDTFHYRLGTIPKKIFIVGNNDELLSAPPALGHGVVVSAVHDEPILTGASDPNFYQYTATWKAVDNVTPEYFYAVENTTKPNSSGIQYYGNTSYIQIRSIYTPDVSEVYNVSDLSPRGSFTGPTFYTANLLSNGDRLIFEEDPREAAGLNPDEDIDQNSILVYTSGINYHKFPIHDKEAGLPVVQRNTVLRNHSYLYEVSSIGDLGSPDENVPPVEPIENATTLEIRVQVAPWSKIENTGVPI